MYSVYKIYQADKLVLVTYYDIIPEFTDTTKLKLILNGPTIPIALFEDYYKSPDLFSITTHETSIYNALDANQIIKEELKLIGTDKADTRPKLKATKKPRTKKVVKQNED
ncbi:hypothetical protein [Acinetobacter pecorum]|uniref:Uncharacterized protein n=1 Tax=Acinetobacter pecorum TaxID=2762215 RepID=A0ABR8VZQ6_9GAMM|nr:hypothetical protein [Acinetobacter pecorum]MBD8010263.1 hypothetical protein [Acinetobacter pecorum]